MSGRGNAARRAAPKELLGVYATHRPLGHVHEVDAACEVCALLADLYAQDRRAKDLEAGRQGEDPDYEGSDLEDAPAGEER